jgi:hypothetical protein
MKHSAIILFILICFFGPAPHAQTIGELTVSVTTSHAGGNYAPRNIVAIWIENDSGDFIKTLLAYAQNRRTHLNTWQSSTQAAGSEYNVVDAITGATRTSHNTRNCTWDGTDFMGIDVPDGNYRLRMELTDKNSTGNFSTFPFVKGPDQESQNPANKPSFSSVSINWNPIVSDVSISGVKQKVSVFPNPTTGMLEIKGDRINSVEIRNMLGNLLFTGTDLSIDLSDQLNGIYLLVVNTESGRICKKIIKN